MATEDSPGMTAILEQLKKANGESAARRAKLKTLQEKLDATVGELDALKAEKATFTTAKAAIEAERETLRTKLEAAPSELQKTIDGLTMQIRTRDHRDAFKALYDDPEVGLNAAIPVEKVWKNLDYKPEAEQIDPAAIKALLVAARATDPHLFAEKAPPPGDPAPPPVTPPTKPPGPNAQRGAAEGNASGILVVTRAQHRDVRWMAANRDKIAQASREGRLQMDIKI